MIPSSAIKSLLSYLLITSFLLTPLSSALAMIEGSSGSSSNSAPSTNNGGLVGGDNHDDNEGDNVESEEERDKRLADETKAEISAAIEAAGLDLGVDAVYGAEPSGSSVSVAGVSMGKEEALAAIDAMGEAKSAGIIGVVATDKTLAAYASGNVCAGCVVGLNTATVGTPTEVAKAEADYVVSMAGVVGARLVGGLTQAVSIKAKDLTSAINSLAPKILPTSKTKGTNIVPPSVIAQYQEMGRGLQSAGISNLSGKQIEKGYVYDNETQGLIGLTTGKKYEVSNIGLASNVPQIASANPNSTIKVDTTNGLISATDITTGIVHSYDLEGNPLISNYDITAGLSWDGTAYGNFLLLDDNKGGYEVLNATAGTPSSWIATGDFDLGTVPAELQTQAIQYGYTIDSAEELVALALSGELSPDTRQAIVKAYNEDPTFATLDLGNISEVGGILGAFAGEAYRADRTLSEQLLVDRYISSITYDPLHNNESAFDRYKHDGEAMLALAEAYTSGQLTDNYGLKVTAPVEVANHTYASNLDPDNPNAHPLTAGNAWITEVNENATRVGGRYYTELGYITSELNNSSNWRGLLVNQDFNYDEAVYGSPSSDIYTMVTSVPVTNLGIIDLGNDPGVDLTSLSGTYSFNTNHNSSQPNQSTSDTPVEPVIITGSTDQPLSNTQALSILDDSVQLKPGVSLENARESTVAEINRLAIECGCGMLLNSVTDGNHEQGDFSHANGYKFDVGSWDTASGDRSKPSDFTNYMTDPTNGWVIDGTRSGDDVYTNPNHPGVEAVFENEGVAGKEHWDIKVSEDVDYSSEGTQTTSNPSNPSNPSISSGLSWLGGAIDAGRHAALKAADDALNNDAIKELNKAMDNPLFGLYIWAVSTFGGSGAGNLNTDQSGDNSSEDSIPPCPLNPGESDPYKEWRTQNGNPACTATSTPPANNQAGAVILPFLDSNFVQYLLNIFGWKKTDNVSTPTEVTIVTEPEIAIVKITIDDSNKVVALSRPDMEALITDQSIDVGERNVLLEKLKETPVIFDETGAVIYSNGVYTPPIENGREIASNQVYSYVIEYVDANGNVVPTTNETDLSDNVITDSLRSLLGKNRPFTIDNVKNITYYLVDPDKSIPNDEYYLYTIMTSDGSFRTIDVPQFTSVSHMTERFQKIGYSGDVLTLTALATLKQPEPRTFDKVASFATELLGKFVDALNGTSTTLEENQSTVLPEVTNELTSKDIGSINIYPNSTITCPDTLELSQGFMYTVVLTDQANSQKYINITDGRCGSTDPSMMIAETARHLQENYGIQDVAYSSIASKTTFHTEATAFIPGVTSKIIGEPTGIDLPTTSPSNTENSDTTSSSTPTQLPNLTNTIIFEVKAVGSDNKILADWANAEKITISAGVQLYFRWKGNDYQQCLPFLNDNGNYSLTRTNRAMITGDTETEDYSVTERTGVYRIECGGQRNNEFGVDAREIEVTIQ